jgi:hypothetical protein
MSAKVGKVGKKGNVRKNNLLTPEPCEVFCFRDLKDNVPPPQGHGAPQKAVTWVRTNGGKRTKTI